MTITTDTAPLRAIEIPTVTTGTAAAVEQLRPKKPTRLRKLAVILTLGALPLAGCGIQYDGDSTGCTVTDKYVQVSSETSQKMLATSCGVFTVEDELSQGEWNSADLYASIEIGKTYDFETYGFRNGFWSAFPNIAAATEAAQ